MMRIVAACWLVLAACSAVADREPPAHSGGPMRTTPCALQPAVTDGDVNAGSWQRVVAPHGNAMSGKPLTVNDVVITCDGIADLAHDPGPGGKVFAPEPAKLLWSSDGTSWEPRALPSNAFIDHIASDGSTWVAVGSDSDGSMIASSHERDTSDWRVVFRHSERLIAIAAGAGTFVAVTQGGVAVSHDGDDWHWAQLPPKQALYFDVAFASGRFVVAGVGAVLNSSDGETWQESTCDTCAAIQTPSGPAAAQIAMQEVHVAGDAFFGFGASGNLASFDGLSFVPYGGERIPNAALGKTFLSANSTANGDDDDALFASSDNGATWSSLPLRPVAETADCTQARCITAGNQLLVFKHGLK